MPSEILHIRVDPKLKARLEALAAAHPGSFPDWCRSALAHGTEYLERTYPKGEPTDASEPTDR